MLTVREDCRGCLSGRETLNFLRTGLARPIRRNIGRAGLIKIFSEAEAIKTLRSGDAARCKNRTLRGFPADGISERTAGLTKSRAPVLQGNTV